MARHSLSLFLLLGLTLALVSSSPTKIDRSLIKANGKVDIVVTLTQKTTSSVLTKVKSMEWASRGEKITSMVSLLKSESQEAQKDVLSFLTQEKEQSKVGGAESFESIQPFWISNKLVIRGANLDLVEKLQSRPDVATVEEEKIYQLETSQYEMKSASRVIPGTEQPNIQLIRAPPCWAYGQQGQDAVVASIGTGVRATHEAIAANYRNQSGWFDAFSGSLEPFDDNGVGTHEMGVMVGNNGIGVAPSAKWISCKACGPVGCSMGSLLWCSEFVLCPTDAEGNNPDCSLAPRVVINGWGGGSNDPWFNEELMIWREGGIIPIFPIGAAGPDCESTSSPGDSKYAVAVTGVTEQESVSSFAGHGPTEDGRIKPDVAAPANNIYSATSTSDDAYASFSGTSMAVPHAGGVAALIVSEKPDLSVDQVQELLLGGAVPVTPSGQVCGGIPDDEYPNNSAGHGRLDALRSVAATRKYQH